MKLSNWTSAAFALTLFACLTGTSLLAEAQRWTGQASVIDGDTIDIQGTRFRLHGIDAPESNQLCQTREGQAWRCGQKASLALSDLIGRGHVTCRQTDKDRYGRIVAVCLFQGQDLNRWMVRKGWAVAYTKYSLDYTTDEKMAAITGTGIWAGTFVQPSEWRRGDRLGMRPVSASGAIPPARAKSDGCDIKGNISRKGQRIFHMPGTGWYAKTKINEAAGERWFCTKQEAQSAGWRKAG